MLVVAENPEIFLYYARNCPYYAGITLYTFHTQNYIYAGIIANVHVPLSIPTSSSKNRDLLQLTANTLALKAIAQNRANSQL